MIKETSLKNRIGLLNKENPLYLYLQMSEETICKQFIMLQKAGAIKIMGGLTPIILLVLPITTIHRG